MTKKSIFRWLSMTIVSMLAIMGLGQTMVHAVDGGPKTDVIITKLESSDEAKDMDLEDLANGVDINEYFDDAKPLEGVSFTWFEVSENDYHTMMASPGNFKDAADVTNYIRTGTTGETGINGQVTIKDLAEGFYWIVENEKGTITSSTAVPFGLALPFTNVDGDGYLREIHVYPKNTLDDTPPEIDKEVEDENAAIGELNTWTITVDLPVGVEDYKEFKFYDEIDYRLDFQGLDSLEVLLDGTPLDADAYNATYNNNILEVDFTDKGALKGGEQVVVTFQTRINEHAIMGQDIENNVILEYDNGHGTTGETEPDTPPHVHTGGRAFRKIDDGTEKTLEGAEFKIQNEDGGYVIIGADGAVTFGDEADATVFESDAEGLFEVKGLPYGAYVLVETKAPNGYALPTDPTTDFYVDANSYYEDPTEVDTGEKPADHHMTIYNKKMTIPQTGGIGTAIFTAVGIVFILFAVGYYRRTEQA